ncbi:TOBE domain-containing protein [Autumnicola musiva]|uniref:TOBE domain-containing protein n=1 Tax=Autumnicola musiva TaxID=3075589 RepID=A0ABU3D8E0_9FLAO|nr:TOBE domain-containing protein [Zunongwangia sp. F117]MDT0677283.1 TOBE domain-containing protein [Zunongwangia sp. F117]
MNTLKGEISAIHSSGSLSMLSILVKGLQLKVIVVETPETASYLRTGKEINLLFKETEVILACGPFSAISIENRIPGTIIKILQGELLSEIKISTLQGEITAVIANTAIEELQLSKNTEVIVMVKSNEIMLSE